MKIFLLMALVSSLTTFTEAVSKESGTKSYGTGGFYMEDPCAYNLNMAIAGTDFGSYNSVVRVDQKRKLVIDRKYIHSETKVGNVTTIIYKTYLAGTQIEVLSKLAITEEDGKITQVARFGDAEADKKIKNMYGYNGGVKMMGLPFVKKTDISFEHEKEGCHMTGSEITVANEDEKKADRVIVTYDKKTCDAISPILDRIGRQNALECGNLFSRIEESYKERSKEISKDGKELILSSNSTFASVSKSPDLSDRNRNGSVMNLITNCITAGSSFMPAMGLGMGGGTFGGYIPNESPTNSSGPAGTIAK